MKKQALPILCALLCLLLTACGTGGEPVRVALIDTGISVNGIPQENVAEGSNYLYPDRTTQDTYGHGTAVASVILANAPDAILVPLVSNAYERGKIVQVDNAVLAQMILDAVDVFDCDIINISAGLMLDKSTVREAVEYAEAQGVLVVASVGNDYRSQGGFMYYPAGYDSVLAVGSVNQARTEVSDFSQRGPWVDIYACGEAVTITTLSGSSRESDGTSYSAAYVTAQAVRLQENDPALLPAQARALLLDSADILADGTKVLP